jgi:phosphatidate cytidylyltransferase
MLTSWLPGVGDVYYRFFSSLIISLLVLVSLLLCILKLFPKKKELSSQIWKSFKAWFIMAPIALSVVGMHQKVLVVALLLLSIFAIKEFSRATGLYEDWGFIIVIYIGVVILYFSIWVSWYGLFVAMPVYIISVILMIPIFRNQYKGMIQKIALGIVAFIYLGWFPSHLGFIGTHPHRFALLLFIAIGTELNDAAAFTCGKFFGKHPLIPNISPKKTVEGSLGALLITSLYVLLVHKWLPGFGVIATVLSIPIIWIGGTLGDLVISYIKRDIGIKDMGVLIPGHGGLLDRVDSLIFVAPLYFHMVTYYVGFPGGLS